MELRLLWTRLPPIVPAGSIGCASNEDEPGYKHNSLHSRLVIWVTRTSHNTPWDSRTGDVSRREAETRRARIPFLCASASPRETFPGPTEGNVSRGAAENAEGKAIRTERRLWRSAAGMQTGPILFLLRALASSRETFSGSHFYAVHNTLTAPTRHAGGRARRTRSGSVSTHNASQSAQHRALLPSTALGGH